MASPPTQRITHLGGCHCGAVRFEVDAPGDLDVYECNCSICRLSGFLHLIVSSAEFRLMQGSERLATYRFHTQTARHLFCSTCGVKSFYVPRSHPDGFSVNARCLDDREVRDMKVHPVDGANWESGFEELPD